MKQKRCWRSRDSIIIKSMHALIIAWHTSGSLKETLHSLCGASRYKIVEHQLDDEEIDVEETDLVGKSKRILAKVLHHFPLIHDHRICSCHQR